MASTSEINDYLHQVKKQFPFAVRKRLICELKDNITDYTENHADASLEDIVSHFGQPETFASEYFLSLPENERQNWLQRSKQIKRIVLVSSIIVILLVAAALTQIVLMVNRETTYYYTVDIIED